MKKLPISVGILSWASGQTLIDTLVTYYQNGLFDIVDDVTVLFQEFSDQDYHTIRHFRQSGVNINCIGLAANIGIGQAFVKLAKNAESKYFLTLEHDWKLIESKEITYDRLKSGIDLIDEGYTAVRYRHRTNPGSPHFSMRHIGKELTYFDAEIQLTSPHLLDSLHWLDPAEKFPEQIQKNGEYFVTTSRYGNWTNNPCLYNRNSYIDIVSPHAGNGIALEGKISYWWARENYGVAHGEGLFRHVDLIKYGK